MPFAAYDLMINVHKQSANFSGYRSRQTDFGQFLVLPLSYDQVAQLEIVSSEIADALVADKRVDLAIVGHSDIFGGASSEEERLRIEAVSAFERARSAADFLFYKRLMSKIAATGFAPPNNFNEATNLSVSVFGAGASDRVVIAPQSEPERAMNRRVEFYYAIW